MKHCLWGLAAVALVAVGPARAGDIVYKPIDTSKFLVRPTKTTANLAERTINAVGQFTANSIESNGYVKTINNLFSKKIVVPHTQTGPSALPAPTRFASTYYKNYHTPVRPSVQRMRR
jgi:hypothetical protein